MTILLRGLASIALLCLCAVAEGQIVQLPSFHVFSYRGAVQVPDGGTAALGSTRYGASTQTQRSGWFPNRSGAGIAATGQATATVTVIDLQELDRQLLGKTPEEFVRSERRQDSERTADRAMGISDRGVTAASVVEGKALVRSARQLFQQGRREAAIDAYELALPLLDERLRQLALAEMHRQGLR